MLERDYSFMRQALALARQAGEADEVPVGALVIAADGTVLGRGYNQVEERACQLYHAEVLAIREATKNLNNWHLDACTLYVTLEPCTMCMGLAALSRMERIVYGAESPLFGYRLDNGGDVQLYTNQIKNITGHVLADEAAHELTLFFGKKRNSRD